MGGKSFRSDEEMQQAVHEWLRSQPKDFFSSGIHALPKSWNTCMESNGDYTEKLCHCVPFVFNKLREKIFKFSFDSPSYIQLRNSLLQAILDRFSRNSNTCGMQSVPILPWYFEIRAINNTAGTIFCRGNSADKSF
jgi:hypothetical protein